jgi:O-acetyl-ADP-ribose deacetylase
MLLSRCYENSFKLSLEKNIKTIAFPAISCGIYGYPIEDACNIALEITIKFLKENNKKIEKVIFVLFSKKDQNIYEQCLNEIGL